MPNTINDATGAATCNPMVFLPRILFGPHKWLPELVLKYLNLLKIANQIPTLNTVAVKYDTYMYIPYVHVAKHAEVMLEMQLTLSSLVAHGFPSRVFCRGLARGTESSSKAHLSTRVSGAYSDSFGFVSFYSERLRSSVRINRHQPSNS